MKKLFGYAVVFVTLLFLVGCDGQKTPATSEQELTHSAQEAYLKNVDGKYAYEIAKRLEEFRSHEQLGYRTAGSEAEKAAGNMLYEEMKKIGLSDVTKDEFTVDSWTFEKATLTYQEDTGEQIDVLLGGYAVTLDTQGPKQYEIVYAGQGTADDFKDLDVTDKLVLIDINQRENWWINYPAYEAKLHGAAAVIAAQDGGYAEVSDEALNSQDVCGPADAPAFSISRKDANALQDLIKKSGDKPYTVTLDAKTIVEQDGKTANIVGMIPGKDPDSMILYSAHYDAYFDGFQDDGMAIGLMMEIAKGMIDSGYQPNKTLVFVAQAAEEWGVTNSRYDWSTGAYNQIFRVHPEWVGKAIVDINFELPAYEHMPSDEIRTTYEYAAFLREFVKTVPQVDGVYADGVDVVAPLRTWSDDYSYSLAGVPAMRNDFQDSQFMHTHYHSQFDDMHTYNEKALQFHLQMYGLLGIAYDDLAALPLDFTERLSALESSLEWEDADPALTAPIQDIISSTKSLANDLNEKIRLLNEQYLLALHNKDENQIEQLEAQSKQLNAQTLAIYKYAQDHFVRLTWEDEEIFPHEHYQTNLFALKKSIEALKDNDPLAALDEYLYLIDNNWYAYSFSNETYRYFTDYVLEQPDDRLLWGAGRIMGHIDLYEVIQSLQEKTEVEGTDFTEEISVLESAYQASLEGYVKSLSGVQGHLQQMNTMIEQSINE